VRHRNAGAPVFWLTGCLKSSSQAESPRYLKKQIGIKQIGYEQLAQTLAFAAIAGCILPALPGTEWEPALLAFHLLPKATHLTSAVVMLLGLQLLEGWGKATMAPGESREGFPAWRGEEEGLKHRRPSNFVENWVLKKHLSLGFVLLAAYLGRN